MHVTDITLYLWLSVPESKSMHMKVIVKETTSSCQDFTYEIGVKGQLRIYSFSN